jgi:hypothetical protein
MRLTLTCPLTILPLLLWLLDSGFFVIAQSGDAIDFSKAPGFANLRECVRNYFVCYALFCDCSSCSKRVAEQLGCGTNECLCRPDTLYNAQQYARECILTMTCRDQAEVDAQAGVDMLTNYCAAKGYTVVSAPASTKSTTSYQVTTGVYTSETQSTTAQITTTVYISERQHVALPYWGPMGLWARIF